MPSDTGKRRPRKRKPRPKGLDIANEWFQGAPCPTESEIRALPISPPPQPDIAVEIFSIDINE